MLNKCKFTGSTPSYFCRDCSLFLETCYFIVTYEGYALGSECDCFFCEYCDEACVFND